MNGVKDFNYYYSFYNPQAEKFGGIDLYQLSDQSCLSNKTISSHTQICDELTIIYGGDGIASVNGNEFDITKGSIHLCFKGEKHSITSTGETPLRFYCVGFALPRTHPLYDDYIAVKKSIKQGGASVAIV